MSHPVADTAPGEHVDALALVRDTVAAAAGPAEAGQRAVEVLYEHLPHYDWIGIYWVDPSGTELILGPWAGPEPTEHTRIPIGTGICGAAAASGQTEIIDDVNADPRYLACFTTTRSEIVVPIHHEGQVVGEIDIDGSDPAAFGPPDAHFLEEVAALLAPMRPRPDTPI